MSARQKSLIKTLVLLNYSRRILRMKGKMKKKLRRNVSRSRETNAKWCQEKSALRLRGMNAKVCQAKSAARLRGMTAKACLERNV